MDSVTIGCFAAIAVLIVVILRIELTNRNLIRSMTEHVSDMDGQSETAQADEVPENGISPEVIAAVSAAVACIYPGASIRSLHRVSEKPRSCWQTAGLLESTRPF